MTLLLLLFALLAGVGVGMMIHLFVITPKLLRLVELAAERTASLIATMMRTPAPPPEVLPPWTPASLEEEEEPFEP